MPGIDIKNFEKNQKRKKVRVLEFSLELEANMVQKKPLAAIKMLQFRRKVSLRNQNFNKTK